MTCDDCKFYGKECESHSQVRMLGKERNMEICEIFCPKFVDCMECTRFKACQALGELTGRLTSCPDFRQKPKTNSDRIRAMTDEELAELLLKAPLCRAESRVACRSTKSCLECLTEWLQQPAEEGEEDGK